MPKCRLGWCGDITRNLAKKLIDEILPASGEWVSLDWLVCRTHDLVTPSQAVSNYNRHAPQYRPAALDEPFQERWAAGYAWLVIDAMKGHCKAGRVEWNGLKGDDERRYRRVIPVAAGCQNQQRSDGMMIEPTETPLGGPEGRDETILRMAAEGRSSRAIALTLAIGKTTVNAVIARSRSASLPVGVTGVQEIDQPPTPTASPSEAGVEVPNRAPPDHLESIDGNGATSRTPDRGR